MVRMVERMLKLYVKNRTLAVDGLRLAASDRPGFRAFVMPVCPPTMSVMVPELRVVSDEGRTG